MRFIDLHTKAECRFPADAAAALGNFDGVHVGHRRLFAALPDGAPRAVFTFADLAKAGEHSLLTTLDERLSLIGGCMVDYAAVADFAEVRDLSPEDFGDFLATELRISRAVCGYNFTFGKNASGGADDLCRLLGERGVGVTVVPEATVGGETVSSTAIRKALAEGDVGRAGAMLGREYSLTLPVAHGRALGRKLGFPTVNQPIPDSLAVPRYGVYAVRVNVDGAEYRGICNVGVRPTVDGENLCAETHIVGFDGDLYGKVVTVSFDRFIRDERKFADADELRLAIGKDISECF